MNYQDIASRADLENWIRQIEIAGTPVSFCCGRCKTKVQALETAEAIRKVFSSATFDQAFEMLPDEDEK